MMSSSRRRGLAVGLAGAMVLATPSFAAPVLSNTASVKSAMTDGVVDVRWRGRGAAVGAGLAFGALAGAAALGAATAPAYYGYPYASYGYPAYYGYPGYGAYAYESPVYGSSYAYPYQTCGVDAGYGRWDYSQC